MIELNIHDTASTQLTFPISILMDMETGELMEGIFCLEGEEYLFTGRKLLCLGYL